MRNIRLHVPSDNNESQISTLGQANSWDNRRQIMV
jgi:hypothetical protein